MAPSLLDKVNTLVNANLHSMVDRALQLWPSLLALLIPVAHNLAGGITAAEAKGQTEC